MVDPLVELNFDGLVGPTHNFAGLSPGNLASAHNREARSNPRAAALQGLDKMAHVASLGVPQAVLPPQLRPHLPTLRRLGFQGSDEQMIAAAALAEPALLRRVSSASSMWVANAATVAPSSDTRDGRLHLVPANLTSMMHRSLEAEFTTLLLRRLFADEQRFAVHEALPASDALSDEGAANHTRLCGPNGGVHLFGWGRSASQSPSRLPARQSLEASRAVARLLDLPDERVVFAQQDPVGIDGGAFHSDVLLVGNHNFLMLHERALVDQKAVIEQLELRLGEPLKVVQATESELPLGVAVSCYPFNSQVLSVPSPSGETMVIVAPKDAEENALTLQFLQRVTREVDAVSRVDFLELRQSMRNGGGPACLRLRVPVTSEERGAINARVLFDESLEQDLRAWVGRNYRDQLEPRDLADPALIREVLVALDELTALLRLGSVYEFQTPG
jgi:succinylarginine dihydrolase